MSVIFSAIEDTKPTYQNPNFSFQKQPFFSTVLYALKREQKAGKIHGYSHRKMIYFFHQQEKQRFPIINHANKQQEEIIVSRNLSSAYVLDYEVRKRRDCGYKANQFEGKILSEAC